MRELSRFLFIVGKNAEFNKMGMDNLGRVIGPSASFLRLSDVATSLLTSFYSADILSAGKELDLAQMQMDSDRVNRVATVLIKDWAIVFSVRLPHCVFGPFCIDKGTALAATSNA